MTLRNHQIQAVSLLAALLLLVPWVTSAAETSFFQEILWSIVVAFFGLFVGLAGALLDVALNEYVIGFGTKFLEPNGVGFAIDTLWVAVRDIFNLTFIFGLVFIGFKMILNSDDSNTRRWLIHLILAALLVNFSLFITKFIVDFTNITATQIASTLPESKAFPGGVSISEPFMDTIGITEVLGFKALSVYQGELPANVADNGVYGVIFGTMILFIVMTFVFATGGIILIIRYAALCLFMVLSPLMFLGWVFPQLQSITSKWWHGFLGRAFFAPVFVLMVYFAIKVLNSFYTSNAAQIGNSQFTKVLGGGGNEVLKNFTATFPPFILSCVFLIAAVVIANKLGADGASAALRIGNNATAWGKRKLQGTARVAAKPLSMPVRYSANRAGNFMNTKLDKWQKDQGWRGAVARNKWVGSTIDDTVRAGATRLKNVKGTLANTADEATRKHQAIIDRANADQEIRRGHTDQDELDSGTIATTGEIWDQNATNADGSKGAMVSRSGMTNDEIKTRLEQNAAKGRQAANNLSQKELELMAVNDKTTFDKVVGDLNAATFDKMMDSDNFSPTQKADMFAARKAAIEKTFTKIIGDEKEIATKELQKLSIEQIETLGDDFIRENAHLLSQSQMDDIKKSKKFTETQKNSYKDTRNNKIISDPGARKEALRDGTIKIDKHGNRTFTPGLPKKPAEIASLPFDAIINPATHTADPDIINLISPKVLEAIVNNKTMDANQRKELRDEIMSNPRADVNARNYLNSPQAQRFWGNY